MAATPTERLRAILGERGVPAPPAKLLDGEEEGTLLLTRRLRNATHLDVDQLDRRLRALLLDNPAAERHLHHEMDFSEATPADPDGEATLDLQEAWDNVRPTLEVRLRGAPTEAELAAVAAVCEAYVAAIAKVFPLTARH